MLRTKRILGILSLAALVFATLGCGAIGGGAARQRTMNDIKQVLLAYHSFLDDKRSPPADEKEFSAWVAAKQPEASAVFAKIQAEGYKVYWGANPVNLTAGSSNTVLVYPGNAATNGGIVGMADGSVRQMTADEFTAAAKPPAAK